MGLEGNIINFTFVILLIGIMFWMKKSGKSCCSQTNVDNKNVKEDFNQSSVATAQELKTKIEIIEKQNQRFFEEIQDLKNSK